MRVSRASSRSRFAIVLPLLNQHSPGSSDNDQFYPAHLEQQLSSPERGHEAGGPLTERHIDESSDWRYICFRSLFSAWTPLIMKTIVVMNQQGRLTVPAVARQA